MSSNPFLYLFKASTRYKFIKPLGRGAYGYVCSATDTSDNTTVAIKRIACVNNTVLLRTLREIKLLRHFNHTNIVNIKTCAVDSMFSEIYIVMECLHADLHYIIYSKQPLSNEHIRYLTFQLLSGLRAIHGAGIIHRDIKPSNCLVTSECRLKICDFGLARESNFDMSNYVQTRWYRAPELLCRQREYTTRVDMWSVGCILAELLGKTPLLPGKSTEDQLRHVFNLIGTPGKKFVDGILNESIKCNIRNMLKREGVDLGVLFHGADEHAVDLLGKLLCYEERLGADEAAGHRYFRGYVCEEVDVSVYEDNVDGNLSARDLKRELYREIMEFHTVDIVEKSMKIEEDIIKEE